jgi:hypothetical protein
VYVCVCVCVWPFVVSRKDSAVPTDALSRYVCVRERVSVYVCVVSV